MTLPASFSSSIEDGDDMVARRIVLRREVWDQLVHLAEALQVTREVDVSPTDVAVIALEAGLAEVRRTSGAHKRPASASQSASRSQTASRAQARGTAQPGPSGKASRGMKRPSLDLTTEERAEVAALVADVASARGRQRTIALWLGANKKRVALEALRELSIEHQAYNVANFAQNMKKDGALFEEIKAEGGERLGWRLTKQGAAEAKLVLESALQPA
jgi:hypothetical protein